MRKEFAWGLVAAMVLACVALFVNLSTAVFATLFALLAWWAWVKPVQALYTFLVVAPVLPMLKITQTIGTITLAKDVMILVLFARVFAWPLITKRLEYKRAPLVGPIIVLGIWTAVTMLRADVTTLGILRAREIGLYALMYFVVVWIEKPADFWKRAALWLGVGALASVLLAGYQWFFAIESAVLRFDPAREIWIPRLSSFMAHPSIFGEYLVLISSLALAGVLVLRNKLHKLWLVLAYGVVSLVIFLTYSRAVWIGLAAASGVIVALYLWQKYRHVFKRFIGLGAVLGLVLFFVLLKFTPAGVFIRSAVDPTYGSNEERLEFAVRLVAPLTNTEAMIGRGLGDVLAQNFREVDVTAFDITSGAARDVQLAKNATLVDNQYLKTFVEMGLVGLLIYAWIFWIVLRMIVKSETSLFGLAAGGFVVAFMLQGLFIDVWDIFPTNVMFWMVVGLIGSKLETSAVSSKSLDEPEFPVADA